MQPMVGFVRYVSQPLAIGGYSGAFGSGCVIIPRVCTPHANPAKLSISISTHGIPPNPACPIHLPLTCRAFGRVTSFLIPGNAGPDLRVHLLSEPRRER